MLARRHHGQLIAAAASITPIGCHTTDSPKFPRNNSNNECPSPQPGQSHPVKNLIAHVVNATFEARLPLNARLLCGNVADHRNFPALSLIRFDQADHPQNQGGNPDHREEKT